MRTLLLILLWTPLLPAQVRPVLEKTIPLPSPVDQFAVDQFGHLYLVQNSQVEEWDAQGKRLASFSDPLLGDISDIDALNPLRPLLFYEPVNTLILLDNRLNRYREINLLDLGLTDPQMVTYGDQDHLWVYDQSQDQLIRYAIQSGRESYRTPQITQLLQQQNQPDGLYSSYDQVVLTTPQKGALIFDAQGSFRQRIPLPDSSQVTFHNQRLLCLSAAGGLLLFDLKKGLRYAGLLPGSPARQIALEGDKLYVLRPRQLAVYRLQIAP